MCTKHFPLSKTSDNILLKHWNVYSKSLQSIVSIVSYTLDFGVFVYRKCDFFFILLGSRTNYRLV